jgi:hypothetical protein
VKRVLLTLGVVSLVATGGCDSSDEPSDTWTSPTEGSLYEGDYPECARYCAASLECVGWELDECYAVCDATVEYVPECEALALEMFHCQGIVAEHQCAGCALERP